MWHHTGVRQGLKSDLLACWYLRHRERVGVFSTLAGKLPTKSRILLILAKRISTKATNVWVCRAFTEAAHWAGRPEAKRNRLGQYHCTLDDLVPVQAVAGRTINAHCRRFQHLLVPV